jgi:predicted histone-like DNA-binding protein
MLTFAVKKRIMAIHYRLVQNKIKNDKNYGKYYAHTVKQGEISLEEIERKIEESCSARASDVRLVLCELFDTVRHYMQNGYVVDLKEMGKFSISVKSVCVDDPKEFRRDQHITGYKCNYTPHGQRYKPSDGALAGHIRRGLLEDCEAEETTYSIKK